MFQKLTVKSLMQLRNVGKTAASNELKTLKAVLAKTTITVYDFAAFERVPVDEVLKIIN